MPYSVTHLTLEELVVHDWERTRLRKKGVDEHISKKFIAASEVPL
ncbi:hypothetical protein [Paenibacillus sp. FSL H7-0331]|nr:hypothetical protein [Paenibacillus sp. FSL H7-0331]